MKSLFCILFFLCLHAAAVELNGVASYERYGKEILIVAVSSESPAPSVDGLNCANAPCHIELRITAKKLPLNSYERLWRDAININSDYRQTDQQVNNLTAFLGLIKGALQAGDILTINSVPSKGVKVMVNSVALGTIADNDFFPILLSAWTGPTQYSNVRNGLLANGRVSSQLLVRFNKTYPSEERAEEIKSWLPPTLKPSPATKSRKLAIDKEKTAAELRKQQDAELAAAKLREDKEKEKEKEKEKLAHNALARAVAEEIARINYNSSIPVHLTAYTSRLKQNEHEGSAVVSVTIDRSGNLINMLFVENHPRASFNKAVEETIKLATPFPPVPREIEGTYYTFELPITLKN